MARDLAWALDGIYVAEAARDFLEAQDGEYVEADLPKIWNLQKKAEDAARASSASFIICDTGPEVIRVWAEVKYGHCPEEVAIATRERPYDLVLLCQPDLPWAFDKLREAPEPGQRKLLFERYKSILKGKNNHQIQGRARLAQALKLVQKYISR